MHPFRRLASSLQGWLKPRLTGITSCRRCHLSFSSSGDAVEVRCQQCGFPRDPDFPDDKQAERWSRLVPGILEVLKRSKDCEHGCRRYGVRIKMLKTDSSKPDLSAEMEMSGCAANWFSNVYPEEDPLAFIWWKNSPDDPKFPSPVPPPFPGIPPPRPWPKPGRALSERRG
jgi:hypothetical protein